MAAVTIRACTVEDAHPVESLRVAGWQAAYRGIIPDWFLDTLPVDAERRRRVTAERAGEIAESVAELGQAVLGWVAAGPCRDDDRPGLDQGEVYACYVVPGQWRRGIGRLLLTHALGELGRAGRADVTLWVLEANSRARRFYESFGFSPDGSRQMLDLGCFVPEVRYRRPAP